MATIKLAIVDDDLTSRNTMKSFLKDSKIYEVAADFADGKSAVEWLRQNEVDILLCDMQMPEMNGVELMRLVHIINEFLPVIAVSGFDNFDYVRGSLVNGAANYLLKHELTRERLLEVLEQVRVKYRIEPQERSLCHRSGYCIRDSRDFTGENIRRMAEQEEILFCCSNMVPLAVSPDYRFPDKAMPAEYKQDILAAVMDILSQILGQEYPYLVYVTKNAHLILLLSFSGVRSSLYMLNMLKNLAGRLQRQIIRMLDLTVTMLMGNIHTDLEKAVDEARRLEDMLEDKLYLGGNRIVAAAVTKKLSYGNGDLPSGLWKQLRFDLENDVPGTVDTLDEFFTIMERERFPGGQVRAVCRRLLEMLFEGQEDAESETVLKYIEEYEVFEEFRGAVMEVFHQRQLKKARAQTRYSPMIAQTIEYMEKNYQNDISLETCTEFTGSSYTYLSRAFKQETGMRFVEFLNRLRIKKVKSLLIRKELPMKEIVELAGFRNYNYFFKVFRESEGLTPSEFAAKNQRIS